MHDAAMTNERPQHVVVYIIWESVFCNSHTYIILFTWHYVGVSKSPLSHYYLCHCASTDFNQIKVVLQNRVNMRVFVMKISCNEYLSLSLCLPKCSFWLQLVAGVLQTHSALPDDNGCNSVIHCTSCACVFLESYNVYLSYGAVRVFYRYISWTIPQPDNCSKRVNKWLMRVTPTVLRRVDGHLLPASQFLILKGVTLYWNSPWRVTNAETFFGVF